MFSRFFLGSLLFLSAVASSGSLLYYIWGLTLPAQLLALVFGIVATTLYFRYGEIPPQTVIASSSDRDCRSVVSFRDIWQSKTISSIHKLLITNYQLPTAFLLDLTILAVLFTSRTTESIRSPWEVIPPIVFLLYALSTALLLKSWIKTRLLVTSYPATAGPRHGGGKLLVTSLHFFTTFSVLAIVFPLGFGFDQILHQAAEKVIAASGIILPKTPYYIGQYALVTILHTLTRTPIELLDRFLVPTLAAIFLPAFIRNQVTMESNLVTREVQSNHPVPIAIYYLLFTLPFLTLTTPLNLALLWLLFTVFFATNAETIFPDQAPTAVGARGRAPTVVLLLTLTTLLIHPMVGIPAVIFTVLWLLEKTDRWTTPRTLVIAVLGSIILPAILFSLGAQFSLHQLPVTSYQLRVTNLIYHRFDTIRDFIYSFNSLRLLALLGLLVFAIHHTRKRFDHTQPQRFNLADERLNLNHDGSQRLDLNEKRSSLDHFNRPFIFASLSALLSSVMLLTLSSFPNVAAYETGSFSLRLLTVAFILLTPFLLQNLTITLAKLRVTSYELRVTLTLLLTATFYLLYPTVDDGYVVARGYTTSQHDIEAVHWIARDAGDTPYIVLANQPVSAAAIREFGFKTYFTPSSNAQGSTLTTKRSNLIRDDHTVIPSRAEGSRSPSLFFYSIPTGGPLYQSYLKFVQESPTPQTVREAMDIARVSRAYVVLNRYWNNSRAIASIAARSATTTHELPNYSFTKLPPTLWIFRYDHEP